MEMEVESRGDVNHRYVLTHADVERFADNKMLEDEF